MKDTTKFKICAVIALLVWGNIFVWFLYLSLREPMKTINKRIVEVKSKLTQEQKENLVGLTKENSHLTYIFNYE
jgi:hypothetical protein